jgi:hypothetical protein
MDSQSSIRFWSFASGVPVGRFYKTTLLPARQKVRKASQGTCTLIVNSKKLAKELKERSESLPRELMKQG